MVSMDHWAEKGFAEIWRPIPGVPDPRLDEWLRDEMDSENWSTIPDPFPAILQQNPIVSTSNFDIKIADHRDRPPPPPSSSPAKRKKTRRRRRRRRRRKRKKSWVRQLGHKIHWAIQTKLFLLFLGGILVMVTLGAIHFETVLPKNDAIQLNLPSSNLMMGLEGEAEWPGMALEGTPVGHAVMEAFNNFMDENVFHTTSTTTSSQKRLLRDGKIRVGDVILKKYKSSAPPSIFSGGEKVKVFGKLITSIVCHDFSEEGGADFLITDGGVGQSHVFIDVIPHFMKGYNVSIVVTGVPVKKWDRI